MSSQYRDSSPRFSPPQSTQPFRSLFGGPSQDVDLEPYPESQQGAGIEEDQDELDVIMGDLPLMDDNQSDATYHASDEDESEPDVSASLKRHKKPTIREQPISPPSSPAYRPNRFRGPDSTWRRFTAEERQNAQALETIRARDLTAHLYNSYALRVRARERGQRAVRRDEQLDESETFIPPKRWTAWPMPADEVPRADERLRKAEDDAWTLRMPPDPRDSADLEESVIAMMLKTAKDRFGAREWERRCTILQSRELTASQVDNNDESTGYEGDVKSDPESLDGVELRPVVQADDDKSRRQLRPISRNILMQFDRLLMSLHHQVGGTADDGSGSEGQTDTESMASTTSSPRKRGRSNDAERSQSRGRKQSRRSSHSTMSTGSRSHSVSRSARTPTRPVPRHRGTPRGRSRGKSADRIRQGLRDWSEVLGIAAMVGWPPAVVMRAAKRCSALFGEDMTFQKFHEGKVEKIKEEEHEDVRYVESESEPEPDSPPPSPSPSKGSRSRSRAASIKRDSTSRRASPTNGEVSLGKGKGQHRKQDLICPLKTCSRHKNGFTRTWNLNLHMKRVHPNYRPRDSVSRKPVKIDG